MSIGSMIDELYGTRKKFTIICDIDNTIADTIDRINTITELYSLTHLEKWGPEQVEMFTRPEYINCDKVVAGAEILSILVENLNATLVFITGRGDQSREATESWIFKNFPQLKDLLFCICCLMQSNGSVEQKPTAPAAEPEIIAFELSDKE